MVAVAVRHQDGRHPLAGQCGDERVAVRVERGTWVDHHHVTAPHQIRAGAVVRELRRVTGDHAAHERGDLDRLAVARVVERDERDRRHGSTDRTSPTG